MKPLFPGRFVDFTGMRPGDVFAFRSEDKAVQLGIKVHYPAGNKDHVVRFFGPKSDKHPSVILSHSTSFTRDHTLLVLDNLEIAPTDRYDFVGARELDEKPVKAGWLGLAGDKSFLTFSVQDPGSPIKVGTVDLSSGNLLDSVPLAGWFTKWRIALPTPAGVEVVFEMK